MRYALAVLCLSLSLAGPAMAATGQIKICRAAKDADGPALLVLPAGIQFYSPWDDKHPDESEPMAVALVKLVSIEAGKCTVADAETADLMQAKASSIPPRARVLRDLSFKTTATVVKDFK